MDFPEELLAKIKSIQCLLAGKIEPIASKVNLDTTVDVATLTQKLEKIKNDVNQLEFTEALERNQLASSKSNVIEEDKKFSP